MFNLFHNLFYAGEINEFSFKQSIIKVSDFLYVECASLPSSVNRPHPRFFRVRSIILIFDVFNRVLKAAYFIFVHNIIYQCLYFDATKNEKIQNTTNYFSIADVFKTSSELPRGRKIKFEPSFGQKKLEKHHII